MDTIQKAELIGGVPKITYMNVQDVSQVTSKRNFLATELARRQLEVAKLQADLATLDKVILDAGKL